MKKPNEEPVIEIYPDENKIIYDTPSGKKERNINDLFEISEERFFQMWAYLNATINEDELPEIFAKDIAARLMALEEFELLGKTIN